MLHDATALGDEAHGQKNRARMSHGLRARSPQIGEPKTSAKSGSPVRILVRSAIESAKCATKQIPARLRASTATSNSCSERSKVMMPNRLLKLGRQMKVVAS